jgi:hypothetical protein
VDHPRLERPSAAPLLAAGRSMALDAGLHLPRGQNAGVGRPIDITVRINLVYATENPRLRARTEAAVQRARHFYANAGIGFQVNRYQGSFATSGGDISGRVGSQDFGEFLKSHGGLTVIVGGEGWFGTITGGTIGVFGPSFIGGRSDELTLSDELAHALGNVIPGGKAIAEFDYFLGMLYHTGANVATDTFMDIQETRAQFGLGIQWTYARLLRENAQLVACMDDRARCEGKNPLYKQDADRQ